jgi:hypothetical protein
MAAFSNPGPVAGNRSRNSPEFSRRHSVVGLGILAIPQHHFVALRVPALVARRRFDRYIGI